MIEAIPFKAGHLDLIQLADVHKGDENLISDYETGAANMTYVLTIVDKKYGQVLGVMNGIHIHEKCMECCMIVSKTALWRPVGFFRCVKGTLDHYSSALGLSRVQTTIRCGHPHLVKWMRLLGFEYEATLKKFGADGDDYMIYARFE